MPHSNGHRIVAWSPAATPIFAWPSENFASFAAMEMSASSAAAMPAPTAQPRTALTIGLLQLIMLSTRSRASFMACMRMS